MAFAKVLEHPALSPQRSRGSSLLHSVQDKPSSPPLFADVWSFYDVGRRGETSRALMLSLKDSSLPRCAQDKRTKIVYCS